MNLFKYIVLIIIAFALLSCEKIIEIDLNSTNAVLVVEGNITDGPGPYYIKLTTTGNYFDTNIFPVVSDAVVTISDNAGNSEILVYMDTGYYKTTVLQGVPGRTYTLKISTDGKNYQAVSTMPYPALFDSLNYQEQIDYGYGDGGGENPHSGEFTKKIRYMVYTYVTDDPNATNYYRYRVYKNDTLERRSNYILDDTYYNGQMIEMPMWGQLFDKGDSASIQLLSIDKSAYDYYTTLGNATNGGGGIMGAPPDNPISNIDNEALGYFAAYSVRVAGIKINPPVPPAK